MKGKERQILRRSEIVMNIDAIINKNIIILPKRKMKKVLKKKESAYLEKTTVPIRLENRNIDFVIENTYDMNKM